MTFCDLKESQKGKADYFGEKMRINLNQLRCFYLAGKFNSVSRAADVLFVTPSAVTMQIKKLEQWVGFRLLTRGGNSIRITPAGEPIFALAGKVFREAEILEAELEKRMHSHKDKVFIGCSHRVLATHILPNLILLLKQAHPELDIQIVPDASTAIKERLLADELHFVLTAKLFQAPPFKFIPLFAEELVLVTLNGSRFARKKKILPEDIASIPLLLQERSIYIVKQYIEAKGITPEIVMENLSADVIRQFIRQDLGGALLMRFAVQEEIDRGLFQEIEVEGGLPSASFGLMYSPKNILASYLQNLVTVLENMSFRRDDLVCVRGVPQHSSNRSQAKKTPPRGGACC